MGVSKNKGTPKWMVRIMENPFSFKHGMIWGFSHYFWKHSNIYIYIDVNRNKRKIERLVQLTVKF